MAVTTTDEDPSSRGGSAKAPASGNGARGLIARIKAFAGRSGNDTISLKQNFEDAILDHADIAAALSVEERRMLTNIVSIRESRVDDVMVPRADIVAMELDTDLAGAVHVFHSASHSRLPVYRETSDDIVGMVHIKDLIGYWDAALNNASGESVEPLSLAAIKRTVLYVPPSMPVLDLLLKMQGTRVHMAIVIDEYGGTDGLVTIEDLIEQIVGDILDEHEAEGPTMTDMENGVIIADAKVEIEDLEQKLGLELVSEEDDIDTLGGLVVHLAGRVPQRGELIRHPAGLELEVRDADPRRIRRIRIHRNARSTQKPPVAEPVAE